MKNQNDKTIVIIQARMKSSRLPGKVLLEIEGKPLIWHVVHRVKSARKIDNVVIATSTDTSNDPLELFCKTEGIACFRGDENDVLDRFFKVAKKYSASTVVRVTADCPLIDPQVIDKVINKFYQSGADYASNILKYTYPDGLDVEVFSFNALEKAWGQAINSFEREHVTPYLRASDQFKKVNVENEVDLSKMQYRWTVDTNEDLRFIRSIFKRLSVNGSTIFHLNEVLRLFEKEPELMQINANQIRNEGFYKSISSEKVPVKKRSLVKSSEWKKRAEKVIPSCSQTFSKNFTQFTEGVAPLFIEKGNGSKVWDVDGNEYIDYAMSLGPIILGHANTYVNQAAIKQLENGMTYTLPHPIEVEVAEMLCELIPCAEMVRYGKNGSDVTSGAVRAARSYTGKDIVACSGYHGWQDWFIGTTLRNTGVPKAVQDLTKTFEYNNILSLEKIFDQYPDKVAAVIMEPIGTVLPQPGFLQEVRDLCTKKGAVLIFDEVVTGFRLAMGGAQEYFGVTPDLACFGKAMANGWPIAAVVGRKDLMQVFDKIFFSFTFGGEAVSLAATKATIEFMQKNKVISHLWELGQQIRDGFTVLSKEAGLDKNCTINGLYPRTVISFKDQNQNESLEMKTLFQQECVKRGILFTGAHNICFAHSEEDIHQTLCVYSTAFDVIATALKSGNVTKYLEGSVIQPVFRKP